MDLYRITQHKYAKDLMGNGARLYGGRWNSEGLYALYTSSTRALALLEILVHTSFRHIEAKQYSILTITIPNPVEFAITELDSSEEWKQNMDVTQGIGNRFLRSNNSLLLRVPSIVVEQEYNYLLNPMHPSMEDVRITATLPLYIDNRFYKAGSDF